MAISIRCSGCKTAFGVKEEWAGREVTCPKCNSKVSIPSATPTETPPQNSDVPVKGSARMSAPVATSSVVPAVTPASSQSPKPITASGSIEPVEILGAFHGEIKAVRPPLLYRLGILLASVVMIVLPLIYIMLIVATCWLVYFHMVNNIGMLEHGKGRGKLMVFAAYLAPLIGGATMVFFMAKPFFARAPDEGQPRSLKPEEEKLLFDFVQRICAIVKAPMPKRIDVDCQVNASASFRRGLISMLTGNDLVLTIGMPLVAGMTMRQFAGVLAHEFGHFSQGAGMRLTYIVRTINNWFTRVVYERDEWDQQLAEAAQSVDIRLGILLYFAQFCVWLTRRVLWVFMMVGHIVSGFLLRQMEFDADRYEARLAGSESFGETCIRLQEIGAAHSMALSALQQYYNEGKLGDNLPRLIDSKLDDLPPELKTELQKSMGERTTGLFDTHPADKERIASAKRENCQGVFTLGLSASLLFQNYKSLCENVTLDYYRMVLGDNVKQVDLKPIESILEHQEQQKQGRKALEQFYMGNYIATRPLRVDAVSLEPSKNPAETFALLKAARGKMHELVSNYSNAKESFGESDNNVSLYNAAVSLYKTNISVPKGMFEVDSQASAMSARENAERSLLSAEESMEEFEATAGDRLLAGLQLMGDPQLQTRVPNAAALFKDACDLLPVAGSMSGLTNELRDIRKRQVSLTALLSQLERYESHQELINAILAESNEVTQLLTQFKSSLGSLPYPFDHSDPNMKLAEFLIPHVPSNQQVGAVHDVADGLTDRFLELQVRISARLAEIACQVEAAVGLKPLVKSGGQPQPAT